MSIDKSYIQGEIGTSPISADVVLELENIMKVLLKIENDFGLSTISYKDYNNNMMHFEAKLTDFSDFRVNAVFGDNVESPQNSAELSYMDSKIYSDLVVNNDSIFKFESVFPVYYNLIVNRPINIISHLDVEKMVAETKVTTNTFNFIMQADSATQNLKIQNESPLFMTTLEHKFTGNLDQFKSSIQMASEWSTGSFKLENKLLFPSQISFALDGNYKKSGFLKSSDERYTVKFDGEMTGNHNLYISALGSEITSVATTTLNPFKITSDLSIKTINRVFVKHSEFSNNVKEISLDSQVNYGNYNAKLSGQGTIFSILIDELTDNNNYLKDKFK